MNAGSHVRAAEHDALLPDWMHMQRPPAWLTGTYFSVTASALWVVGLALVKRDAAQKGGAQAALTLQMFFGAALLVTSFGLGAVALYYAPDTTVTAASSSQYAFAYMAATGLLRERFSWSDVVAYVWIALGVSGAAWAMPKATDRESTNFPVEDFVAWVQGLRNNEGFLVYAVTWGALVSAALILHHQEVLPVAKNVTFPLLAGLFGAMLQFMANIVATLVYNGTAGWDFDTLTITAALVVAFGFRFYYTIEGSRALDLRYFQPTSHAILTVLVVLQGLLFFGEWDGMTWFEVGVFGVSAFICLVGAFWVAPRHDTVLSPAVTPCNSFSLPPPLSLSADAATPIAHPPPLHRAQVLRVLSDHGIPKAGLRKETRPADADGIVNVSQLAPVTGLAAPLIRVLPAVLVFGFPLTVATLAWLDHTRIAFTLLAFYFAFASWRFGIHISIFSNVGQAKLRIYGETDWAELHVWRLTAHALASREEAERRWAAVEHYVILPNYKEDMGVLMEAIDSIAASRVAKSQIVLVLAMEEREEGSDAKAAELTAKYRSRFRGVMSTFHPPGLPGEMPGKASNSRWAAQEVFKQCGPESETTAVMTIADADSNFDVKYFDALTYHFLAEGTRSFRTIWQPPILHYRNYHTQPAVVRLASLITSQHELARLADPTARRLPYSTYSISYKLARAVDGWDPDWISEDWHMCAKCQLATSGRLRVCPIFLPVMNYAPEGDSWLDTLDARWVQAKRHALGVSELVYVLSLLPATLEGKLIRKVVTTCAILRLWLHMLAVHLVMATAVVLGPINSLVAASIIRGGLDRDQFPFSGVFALNVVCSSVSAVSLLVWCLTNVSLYRFVRSRVLSVPGQTPTWFNNSVLHTVRTFAESLFVSPAFFLLGASAEWIAAARTAATHKFQYDVALKPTAPQSSQAGDPEGAAATTEETWLLASESPARHRT